MTNTILLIVIFTAIYSSGLLIAYRTGLKDGINGEINNINKDIARIEKRVKNTNKERIEQHERQLKAVEEIESEYTEQDKAVIDFLMSGGLSNDR